MIMNQAANREQTWTSLTNSDSLTGWTSEVGTMTLATDIQDPFDPSATRSCLKLVSSANTASGLRYDFAATAMSGPVRVWIYLEPSSLSASAIVLNATIYLWNAGSHFFTNAAKLHPGWNCVQIGQSVAVGSSAAIRGYENKWVVGTGTPTFANTMRRIRIDMDAAGSGIVSTIYVGPIEWGGWHRSQYCLTIDDGLASVYTDMWPRLQELGLKGTVYVISSQVGDAGYCTVEQLQEMVESGVIEVCEHTDTHIDMSTLTKQQCIDEIQTCQDFILENNLSRNNSHLHHASPFGAMGKAAATNYRDALDEAGCLTAVALGERNAGLFDAPYMYSRQNWIGGTTTLAGFHVRFDGAVHGGTPFVPLIHDVQAAVANGLQMAEADWLAHTAYVHRHLPMIDSVFMSELYAPYYA